jgi:hypothetical protein
MHEHAGLVPSFSPYELLGRNFALVHVHMQRRDWIKGDASYRAQSEDCDNSVKNSETPALPLH